MIIKFTRVTYCEDEVDIPLKEIEERYDGDLAEAIKEKDPLASDEKFFEVAYEDIEEGETDLADEEYMEDLYKEEQEGRRLLNSQYLEGLM